MMGPMVGWQRDCPYLDTLHVRGGGILGTLS